jgi:hypothetical protein
MARDGRIIATGRIGRRGLGWDEDGNGVDLGVDEGLEVPLDELEC